MAKRQKVIVTCAVTGSIHTPSMSPHLPVTPQEIAEAAIGAAEAGASIVHLHARDPETGAPDQSPERYGEFLQVIKQRTNCVLNITTGGAATMSIEERLRPVASLGSTSARFSTTCLSKSLLELARVLTCRLIGRLILLDMRH